MPRKMIKAQIKVGCSKTNLSLIRAFVRKQLLDFGINGIVSEQIVLAVDEACANCMIHQHKCDINSSIEVALYKKEHILYAEIRDTGKAFPIDRYQPPQIDDLIRRRGKGGLGLNLIHRIMDEVKVEQNDDHFVYRLGKRVAKHNPNN